MQEELIEHGIVIKSENGYAEIKLIENDGCEECSAKIFCKPQEDNSKKLSIRDTIGLSPGEKVSITIPGSTILKASFNLYLYPLFILVFILLWGTHFFNKESNSEIYSFLIAIFFVILYYLSFYILSKKRKEKEPNIIISRS